MAEQTQHSGCLPQRALAVALLLLSLAAALATVPGCRGCRDSSDSDTAEKDRKKTGEEATKPDFQVGQLQTLPADDSLIRNFVKPGHAVTAWIPAIANNFNSRADLETAVTDDSGRPLPVGDTKYHLVMSRPAVLPKGQVKYLESTFFVPGESLPEGFTVFLQHRLKPERGGRVVHEAGEPTRRLAPYQYLFVVLSANPNLYGYLKQIESVRPAFDELRDEQPQVVYYHVILPTVDQRVPLPSHPLAWTTIAYVLWDGMLAGQMTPDQQQAMVDWLHWGGQLIISGPDSLEQLVGSFLDPYLPAESESAIRLGPDAFEPINATWSLRRSKTGERLTLNVEESSPVVGVQFSKRPGATYLGGTGELVAERRVGRGRVVVTAFSLTGPDVVNWRCYDSFFNNCLLRRPPRLFTANRFGAPQSNWDGFPARRRDPLFVTTTRFFSRDVGHYEATLPGQTPESPDDWHLDGCSPNNVGGLSGWNDRSGVASEAHLALRDAAGISIPTAGFVFAVLIIYLIILVPVNWGVFRLLGHVEWAWAAAPAIAIIGAVVVIRLAQLDIGFVSSRTELAVLEMHGGYSRAHLTRYTALYSSLSSPYEFLFEDASAMARPFPPTDSPDQLWPVESRRDRGVHLSGFQVDSNTTGFVHSEQMLDLGNSVQLTGEDSEQWQVENLTSLDMHSVGLLYRAADGQVLTCWIDRLLANSAAEVRWNPSPDGAAWIEAWSRPTTSGVDGQRRHVNLKELTFLAARGIRLRPGDVRLVGWTDANFPGLTITPGASQSRTHTLVLVHLRYGPLPSPRPDTNLLVDVQDADPVTDEENDGLNLFPDGTDNQDLR
jgi:hypothetical protein